MSFYNIYHGDCLDILPTIEDKSIDLMVTDPPYFKIINQEWDNTWDSLDHFVSWYKKILNICYDKLKPNGSCYVFSAFGNEFNKIVNGFFDTKFKIKNMIIWHRDSPGRKQSEKRYTLNYEFIWFLTKSDDYTFNLDDVRISHNYKDQRQNPLGKNPGCVWYVPNIMMGYNSEQVGHPTQKPEKLIRRMILASSNINDVVLDPFLGSGTTMKVCQDTQRSCIGMEFEDEYIDIIKNRCFGRQFLDRKPDYNLFCTKSILCDKK